MIFRVFPSSIRLLAFCFLVAVTVVAASPLPSSPTSSRSLPRTLYADDMEHVHWENMPNRLDDYIPESDERSYRLQIGLYHDKNTGFGRPRAALLVGENVFAAQALKIHEHAGELSIVIVNVEPRNMLQYLPLKDVHKVGDAIATFMMPSDQRTHIFALLRDVKRLGASVGAMVHNDRKPVVLIPGADSLDADYIELALRYLELNLFAVHGVENWKKVRQEVLGTKV